MAAYTFMRVRGSTVASPAYSGMNHRQRQILADEQVATRHSPNIAMFDLSQTMTRTPRSAMHTTYPGVLCAPTLLPGTQLWLTLPDPMAGTDSPANTHPRAPVERWIHPDEMLRWNGWPVGPASPADLGSTPSSTKASFASNMFSSSVVMAVFMALMTAIEWADAADEDGATTEDEDAQNVADAFACADSMSRI